MSVDLTGSAGPSPALVLVARTTLGPASLRRTERRRGCVELAELAELAQLAGGRREDRGAGHLAASGALAVAAARPPPIMSAR
jgi:hypothetical protein